MEEDRVSTQRKTGSSRVTMTTNEYNMTRMDNHTAMQDNSKLRHSYRWEKEDPHIKIGSFSTQLFHIVSRKTPMWIFRILLLISMILCHFLVVSCHPITLKTASSSITLTSQASDVRIISQTGSLCSRDEHCDLRFFCNHATNACVPCLIDECYITWKRLPGTAACIKDQSHCGNCLSGYLEQHGHCQTVLSNAKSDDETDSGKLKDQSEEYEVAFWNTKTTFVVIFGALVGCVSIILIFGFVFRWQRKKRLAVTSSEQDKEVIVSEEEFLRPPPYNTVYSGHSNSGSLSTVSAEVYREPEPQLSFAIPTPRNLSTIQEESQMAIAFSDGDFPTVVSAPAEETISSVMQPVAGQPVLSAQQPTDTEGRTEPRLESESVMDEGEGIVEDLAEVASPNSDTLEEPASSPESEVEVQPPASPPLLQVNIILDIGTHRETPQAPPPPPTLPPPMIPPAQIFYHFSSRFLPHTFFDLSAFNESGQILHDDLPYSAHDLNGEEELNLDVEPIPVPDVADARGAMSMEDEESTLYD